MRVVEFKDRPVLQEIITNLRDKNTGRVKFRKLLQRYGRYGGYEIANKIEYREGEVETPLGIAKGTFPLDKENVVIIKVLRAAIPMAEGLVKVFPKARLGFITAKRGEAPSFKIEVAYSNIPHITNRDIVIIVDPMLATGSTMEAILRKIVKEYGERKAKQYIVFSLIAAKEGIERLKKVEEELNIEITLYIGAIDEKLNEKGYIVPGLGDAGDRAFGTTH